MEPLKVEDFRIGNYVNAIYEVYDDITDVTELRKTPGTISGVDIDGNLGEGWNYMLNIFDPYVESFDDIEPIELTEEWLTRFGCTKPEAHDDYGGMLYSFGDGEGSIRIKDGAWDFTYTKIELKYVHQFQNFIHAMTGKDPVLLS